MKRCLSVSGDTWCRPGAGPDAARGQDPHQGPARQVLLAEGGQDRWGSSGLRPV